MTCSFDTKVAGAAESSAELDRGQFFAMVPKRPIGWVFFLYAVSYFSCIHIQSASPVTMLGISTNSAASGDTYFATNPVNGADSIKFSGETAFMYGFLARTNSANNLRIFFSNGSTVAKTSVLPNNININPLVMKDNMKVFVAEEARISFNLLTLQNLAGTYSLTGLNTLVNTNRFGTVGVNLPSTNYILLIGYRSSGTSYTGLFDISTSTQSGSLKSGLYSPIYAVFVVDSQYVAGNYAFNRGTIPIVSRTTCNLLVEISAPGIPFDLRMDTINSNRMWFVRDQNVHSVDTATSISTSTFTNLVSSLSVPTSSDYHLFNFGSYAYLGLNIDDEKKMYIIDKTGWTVLAATFSYTAATSYILNKLHQTPGEVKGDGFVIGFIAFIQLNFQSYYVLFGYCLDRDSNNVCTACYTGGYRDNTSPGNSCFTKAQFPTGFGADETNKMMVACSISTCLACVNDYTLCTGCNTGTGYYLSGTTCVAVTSIPSGSGANLANGQVANCQSTGCTNCQADHTKCLACNTGSNYYLDASAQVCILKTNIVAGKGANLGNGQVSNCAQTGCNLCQADHTLCTQCNTGTGYYLSGTTCVAVTSIPSGSGANLANGQVANCQSTGCTNCQADHTKCTACNTVSNYFLDTTTQACVLKSSIPAGKGANLGNGQISNCAQSGCLLCQSDHTGCTSCNTGGGYYLATSTNACLHTSVMPAGKGGNLATGLVTDCTSTGCTNCALKNTECSQCSTGTGYFLDTPNKACIFYTAIPNWQGGDLVIGNIAACVVSNCKMCKANRNQCQGCDTTTSYYLDTPTSCLLVSNIPLGRGADLASGTVQNCRNSNCELCQANAQVCTQCKAALGYYLESGSCLDAKLLVGQGVDLAGTSIRPCQHTGCLNCSFDYTKCWRCDETNGYFLEGVTCTYRPEISIPLLIQENPYPSQTVTKSVILKLGSKIEGANSADFYRDLIANLSIKVTAKSRSTGVELKGSELTFKKSGGVVGILLDIIVTMADTKADTLDVVITTENEPRFTLNNQAYILGKNSSSESVALLSTIGVSDAKALGNQFSLFTSGGSESGTSGTTFTAVLVTLVAIDPSGVFMKFNQILKIINKLYFININYGPRLDAFLAAVGSVVQTKKSQNARFPYLQQSYAGKLSKEQIELNFLVTNQLWRIGLYSFSWIFRLVNFVISRYFKVKVFYLYIMHYSLKAHLIIFNLVFIDFIWFASHSLLHSRNLPFENYLAAWIVLAGISVDFFLVLVKSFTQEFWRDLLVRQLSARQPKPVSSITVTALEANENSDGIQLGNSTPSMSVNTLASYTTPQKLKNQAEVRKAFKFSAGGKSATRGPKLFDFGAAGESRKLLGSGSGTSIRISPFSAKVAEVAQQPKIRVVDYEATYEHILMNVHMMVLMSSALRRTPAVLSVVECRLVYLMTLFRGAVFQLWILGGQYASGLAIGILIAIEVYKIYHGVYCYVKYKYLKNIICLLMEVMQSCFLTSFLVIAAILTPAGFDEPVIDFYQDAGIWIVIASCVAEYLLLITYITVAAYEFIKNRRKAKAKLAEGSTNSQSQAATDTQSQPAPSSNLVIKYTWITATQNKSRKSSAGDGSPPDSKPATLMTSHKQIVVGKALLSSSGQQVGMKFSRLVPQKQSISKITVGSSYTGKNRHAHQEDISPGTITQLISVESRPVAESGLKLKPKYESSTRKISLKNPAQKTANLVVI